MVKSLRRISEQKENFGLGASQGAWGQTSISSLLIIIKSIHISLPHILHQSGGKQ